MQDLIGAWKILSGEVKQLDGTIHYPFGKNPIGFLNYSENQYMSAEIMAADRPLFANPDMCGGTPSENNIGLKTYFSYFCSYVIKDGIIYYDVLACTIPNWVGEKTQSNVTIEGDIMYLTSSPHLINGIESRTSFSWKRLAAVYS
jgi:hypothetical protein